MTDEDFDPAVILGCAILLVSVFAIWTFFKCVKAVEGSLIDSETSSIYFNFTEEKAHA